MNYKIISKITATMLLGSIFTYTTPVLAYTKDETVYSKLNPSGDAYQTIVSTHIKNEDQTKLIEDLSDLLNIQNVSGNEQFSQDGNQLIWNTDGHDIYYQGDSEKQLPIECHIKYELDGKELSSTDLLGKSGKVKITIDYINTDKHVVNINGKNETLYTPFVIACGTIIDNEHNRNIKITNGKVIDDGNKTVVMGIALPGLQESLSVSKNTIEIPSTIEITMDSTDFELNNIVSYITPKLIEKSDLSVFDNLDDVYQQVNILQSSSQKLESGAKELKSGSTQLTAGSNELKNGVSSAYKGANMIRSEVANATKSLQSDKSDALDSDTLAAIKIQASQSSTLTDKQKSAIMQQAQNSSILSDSLKSQIKEQARQNSILSDELKSQIAEQAEKSATLSDTQIARITAKAQNDSILSADDKNDIILNASQAIAPAVLTDAEQEVLISTAQSVATKSAIESALETAQMVATQTAVQSALETAQTVATQTAIQTALETAQTIATQTAVQTALSTAQTVATQTAEETAIATAKQVGNQAKEMFTNQVVSQMNTLENGLSALTSGLSDLNDGASKLSEGTFTLDSGINTLSKGITQFNVEGIDKICNYINGDVKDIAIRIEKLQQLSQEYKNFTMLNDDVSGEVKFIMIIDNIKKEGNHKQEIILDDKNEEK